jgi:hypothetical protein
MTEILKTSNYDMFSSFTSNREVDQKHVNQLVQSIQIRNLLDINPMLVDKEMRIIDGQHRLEAAKILNVEIYYIMCENLVQTDIAKLNSNQRNWNTMDFINFYTIEGKVEFLKLSKFMNAYPDLSPTAAITITSGNFSRNSRNIREGILDVDNLNEAHKVTQALAVLSKKYQQSFIYDSRFPVALAKAFRDEKFSLDTFIKKIDLNPRAFVKCTTMRDALLMITEIYNYRSSVNTIEI